MLEDAAGIRRVVLACGTVDLRKGIDGLATIIGDKYGQNPFEKGTLFLFCGKRSDRCKGLLWMGTGFLLLYKRFEAGRLSWPRNIQEAADLTEGKGQILRSTPNTAPLICGACNTQPEGLSTMA
jgi:Transposase and inactivated derivatives